MVAKQLSLFQSLITTGPVNLGPGAEKAFSSVDDTELLFVEQKQGIVSVVKGLVKLSKTVPWRSFENSNVMKTLEP